MSSSVLAKSYSETVAAFQTAFRAELLGRFALEIAQKGVKVPELDSGSGIESALDIAFEESIRRKRRVREMYTEFEAECLRSGDYTDTNISAIEAAWAMSSKGQSAQHEVIQENVTQSRTYANALHDIIFGTTPDIQRAIAPWNNGLLSRLKTEIFKGYDVVRQARAAGVLANQGTESPYTDGSWIGDLIVHNASDPSEPAKIIWHLDHHDDSTDDPTDFLAQIDDETGDSTDLVYSLSVRPLTVRAQIDDETGELEIHRQATDDTSGIDIVTTVSPDSDTPETRLVRGLLLYMQNTTKRLQASRQ